jgi:DNA-binding NarL/FixJ family response regulator
MKIKDQNMQIIRLMGDGETDKEIADKMSMPIRTIRARISSMLKKWDCKNRTQLVLKVVLFNIDSFADK